MSTIWRLFCNDMKRLTSNVVTGIIVLGLVFLPSIFSWYNILASWDVFDNTGNLTVAVANTDTGYESDLVPLRVNIGEQVVSALRANDQLNWKFTSEEDAIDGAKSGKYYAAVVIPETFSQDMMTFYSDDVEHAQIVYYTNEKKSAVAPKVTGQGADQVSYQVNKVFTETLTEVALGLSSALYQYADDADVNSRIGVLANHVSTMGTQMSQAAGVLTTYGSLLQSSQALVSGSSQLLGQAEDSAAQVNDAANQSEQAVTTISDAMESSTGTLESALAKSGEGYAGVVDAIDTAMNSTSTLSSDTQANLRNQAAVVQTQIERFQAISSQLKQLSGQVDDPYKTRITALASRLDDAVELQERLLQSLDDAIASIQQNSAQAQSDYADAKQLALQAQKDITGISADYATDIKPSMDELVSETAALVDALESSASMLNAASGDLQGSADSVADQLGGAKQKLDAAADNLNASSARLTSLSQSISTALSGGDIEALRQVLGNDPKALATVLAAPVNLDRHAVFPAQNFGSQMAPLYTTLALWIGSLLLAVAIRVIVSEKALDQLDDPKPRHLFLGRFGVFAVLSFAQSTIMALGNMLFLNVQVSNPILYMICMWVSGLVFTFFIYALVVSFANLGKAIAVFLLIIQVTSGGGSFPLQMLPQSFQLLSPYLPATHAINAMRAAMMGVYQNDFWIEIGCLLLFLIPALLLGLVLRKPLESFLHWYVAKVEDSKLAA